MLFNIVYDLAWFIVVYYLTYRGFSIFMSDYSKVIKILFDIDIKYFNYNNEMDGDVRHGIVHTISSVIAFAILTVNSIVHSLSFLFCMFMIDVVDLNRILLYILLLKLSSHFNILFKTTEYNPFNNYHHAQLTAQIVYVILNYHNINVAIPTIFQIIDEIMIGAPTFIMTLRNVHVKLFQCDTYVGNKLVNLCIVVNRYCDYSILITCWVLGITSMIAFLYAPLHTWSEIFFYYYTAARIAYLYYNHRKKLA